MSVLDIVERQLENHKLAARAIEGLADLVKQTLVKQHPDAYRVLQVVESTLDTVLKGFQGTVTPADIEKRIAALIDNHKVAEGDRAIDAAINAKFSPGND